MNKKELLEAVRNELDKFERKLENQEKLLNFLLLKNRDSVEIKSRCGNIKLLYLRGDSVIEENFKDVLDYQIIMNDKNNIVLKTKEKIGGECCEITYLIDKMRKTCVEVPREMCKCYEVDK